MDNSSMNKVIRESMSGWDSKSKIKVEGLAFDERQEGFLMGSLSSIMQGYFQRGEG